MAGIGDVLAELSVKIKVPTAGLKTGLKGAEGMIKKHHRAIGMGMMAIGAGIVASGVLAVKSYAKMGDEIGKMSKKISFSTVALSEWKHVAEIGGASLETIEKSVKKMSMSIGDLSAGLATYTREFDKIGIGIEDLKGLKPEQQFEKIAYAISGLTDDTERMNVAQKIFGKGGLDLLPIFAMGAQGIAKYKQEAHDLGVVWEDTKAAEDFTDAMGNMGTVMDGLKKAIAENLVPALTPLIDKITAIIAKISAWMKEHPALARVITIATMAIGLLLIPLGLLMIMLPGLSIAVGILGTALTIALGPIGWIALAIGGLIAIGILVWKNWDTIREKAVEIWNNIADFFKVVWEKITGIFEKHWDKILAIIFPIPGLFILVARNWGKITEVISNIWDKILDITGDFLENIKTFLISKLNPWEWIKPAWDKLYQGIKEVLDSIYGGSLLIDWTQGVEAYLKSYDLSEAGDTMFKSFGMGAEYRLVEIGRMVTKRIKQFTADIGYFAGMMGPLVPTPEWGKGKPVHERVPLSQLSIAEITKELMETPWLAGPEGEPIAMLTGKALEDWAGRRAHEIHYGVKGGVISGGPFAGIAVGEPGYPEAFQFGGIVTTPTIGLLGEAGPEAVIPLSRGMGEVHIHLKNPVFLGNESDARKLADIIRKEFRREERHIYGHPML